MKTAFDLLILDLDGTLVDTKKDITNALNVTFSSFNLPEVSEDEVSKYIGTGVTPLIKKRVNNDNLNEFLEKFKTNYILGIRIDSELYKGFEDILNDYPNLKKVILSNKPQKFCDPLINALGIKNKLAGIYGAEAFSEKKPSPIPVLKVLEILNVSPERALIVGDMPSDIISGQTARIKTCAAFYGYGERDELLSYHPDFMIESPVDLRLIIEA